MRNWAGESAAVVFVDDSVSTHLVNEAAAAILELAAVHPVTIEQVSASLFAPSQLVDSTPADIGGDLQLIDETIIGLVTAGLLRRVE